MVELMVLLTMACALSGLVALLAGVGAAYLARRDGASYPSAIGRAAATAAATLTVIAAGVTALAALTALFG
ncbi:hypothetical protein [Nocardiopsis tropica]|uniref:Uncharacterized protein n=1 Tax=Nocardiopsis tropica TaxID=109330 RepID=A0ABU7KUD5_9ACTN|nr:hypothetical protein [Nocardiopsis umidischolae]MEE2052272.1 hypothetical protein [Nocardiopsis umidischolae]